MSRYRHCFDDGRFYAVLSAAGFSLKAIFVKLAYAAGPVDALSLLALRMGLALPLFLWLLWMSREEGSRPLGMVDAVRVLTLGVLGYYLSSLFDFYGLELISAGLERLILFCYPTLVLLLQAVALREQPGARTLMAMGLCYLGLAVAFLHDLSITGGGAQVTLGAAWVFASAITYAFYYFGTGVMVRRLGSMRLAGLAGGASALMVLLHHGVAGGPLGLFELPYDVWFYALLMALFSTVLPIYWMALAIQRMGATHTAVVGNLGPVLTILASWLVLGETISIYQAVGLALVLFGVSRLRSKAPASTQAAKPSTAR